MQGPRLVLLAITASLFASPAAAQAPDPAAVVPLACDTVGTVSGDLRGALPICPAEDDPAPAPAADAAPAEAPPATLAEDPQAAAEGAATEVQETVEEVAEDPASAPSALLGLVAYAREAAESLLGLPDAAAEAVQAVLDTVTGVIGGLGVGAHAAGVGAHDALSGAAGAALGAVEAAREAAAAAVDAVSRLFESSEAPRELGNTLPAPDVSDGRGAGGLLDALRERVDLQQV